jgi:cell division septation protein DedD
MTTTEMDLGGLDVSNSHEPSYYEIALTNRQVVVAFVILLTCLVAAFLSGVWIGRESGVRAQEKLALLTHGSLAGTAAGSDGNPLDGKEKEKTEGQALQEFKFFADSQHRAAGQGKQGGGSADTTDAAKDHGRATDTGSAGSADNGGASTLADDLHRRSTGSAAPDDADSNPNVVPPPTGRAARAAQKNAKATPAAAQDGGGEGEAQTPAPIPSARQGAAPALPVAAPRSRPTASGSTAATSAVGSASTASAKSGSAATNPAGAKSAAAPAPADTAGDVVIQVFSSADKDQADKVRDTLVGAGFQAFLSPLTKAGQTMYRVRIGPFANRAGAEAVAEKVRKGQKLDTWITPK